MIILSLDASTRSTGWAVFDNGELAGYGYITATSADLIKRIHKITDGIKEIFKNYPMIQKVVLEEVRPEQGTASLATYRALMYLQASIEFYIHDDCTGVTIETVYPSEWRKACGIKTGRGIYRSALKEQDIAFIKKMYGIDVNDDIADAICIGYGWVSKHTDDEINWE